MGGKGSAHGKPWNPYTWGSGAYKSCEHAPFSMNVDFALVGKQTSCPRVSHGKLPRFLINLGYEFWASDNWKNLVLDQHLQSSLPLKPAVFSFSGGENDSCFLLPLCLLNYFLWQCSTFLTKNRKPLIKKCSQRTHSMDPGGSLLSCWPAQACACTVIWKGVPSV